MVYIKHQVLIIGFEDAEALRVGWRVRLARWVVRWAVPR